MNIPPPVRRLVERYADGELHGAELLEAESLVSRVPRLRTLVADHQRLRSRVRDVVRAEPIPADVKPRVLRGISAAARRERLRRYRVGGLSTAAIILLGIAGWVNADRLFSRTDAPLAISLADFVRVHHDCAIAASHDPAKVDHLAAGKARPLVARLARFPVAVPEMAAQGYRLRGACTCLEVEDARVMHVHYARSTNPSAIISIFSVDRSIAVGVCSSIKCTTVIPRQSDPTRQRRYESFVSGEFTLLKWEESSQSLVLCGQLDELTLRGLAEGIQLHPKNLDYHASIAR